LFFLCFIGWQASLEYRSDRWGASAFQVNQTSLLSSLIRRARPSLTLQLAFDGKTLRKRHLNGETPTKSGLAFNASIQSSIPRRIYCFPVTPAISYDRSHGARSKTDQLCDALERVTKNANRSAKKASRNPSRSRVIDVLWKFIPEFGANFVLGFAFVTIRRSKA
jgi:hypothetical protein